MEHETHGYSGTGYEGLVLLDDRPKKLTTLGGKGELEDAGNEEVQHLAVTFLFSPSIHHPLRGDRGCNEGKDDE
jgi:hypothetical protein